MTEQNEAPQAPANTVEADQGANPSLPSPSLSASAQTAEPSVASAQGAPDSSAQVSASASADATSGAEPSQQTEPSALQAQPGEAAAPESQPSEATAGDVNVAADSGQAQESGGQAKKRRRRRKKKPGGKSEDGQTASADDAGRDREAKKAREGAGGVFARFFDAATQGKRHAFAAGEVVAGRVAQVHEGGFAVDLFGKATAFVDIFEPHEIPVIPEPPPSPPEGDSADAQGEHAPAAVAPGEGDSAAPSADEVAAASESEPAGGAGLESVSVSGGTDAEAPSGAPEGAAPEAPAVEVVEAAPADQADAAVSEEAAAAIAATTTSEGDQVTAQPQAEGGPEIPAQAEVAPEGSEAPVQTEAAGEAQTPEAKLEGSEAPVQAEATAEAKAEGSEEDHAEDEVEPEPAPPPPPELGGIFKGRIGSVSESGHVVLVNRIVDVPAAKAKLAAARERRRRVRGLVFGFNRGGFDVLVEGIRVFCPASGMSLAPVGNPEELLGQRLEFTVPPAKAGSHGFVVSRRGILERQQRKAAKQLFRSLSPGQRLKGRITQIREFGVFVDLGGIEGLVHQSEIAYSRGVRPADVGAPGDEVEVQVLRVGEGQTRRERERVSLSMKALQEDPWSAHAALLEPGAVHTGKVVRTTEFGAFVELAPQIEGLLHISELGRELKHANQALEEGSEIKVVVERADPKARRISLSKLSQAEITAIEGGADPKSMRPPKPGAQLKVVVDKVEHAGLSVQVPGVFGRRGRGFIPNVEMGTERGTDHRKDFPPGTEIQVKAIGIDRDGGCRFSRKALLAEEEKRAIQDYRREVARQGLGTFGDLLRAKLEGGRSR